MRSQARVQGAVDATGAESFMGPDGIWFLFEVGRLAVDRFMLMSSANDAVDIILFSQNNVLDLEAWVEETIGWVLNNRLT